MLAEDQGNTYTPELDDKSVFADVVEGTTDPFEIERTKHEQRAKRFNIEFREPKWGILDPTAPKRYKNKRGTGFLTGFDLESEEEKHKRECRAKKFGTVSNNKGQQESVDVASTEQSGMELDLREERKDVDPRVQRRLDTIHIYGTDEMSTDDIFNYFKEYGPSFAEWINDSSCNVIFRDIHTARRALEGLSRPMQEFNVLATSVQSPNSSTTASASTTSIDTNTNARPAPISAAQCPASAPVTEFADMLVYGWRRGTDFKDTPLLMRFATVEDVKSNNRKPSLYYKKLMEQWRDQRRGKRSKRRDRKQKRKLEDIEMVDADDIPGKPAAVAVEEEELVDHQEVERRRKRLTRFFPHLAAASSNTSLSGRGRTQNIGGSSNFQVTTESVQSLLLTKDSNTAGSVNNSNISNVHNNGESIAASDNSENTENAHVEAVIATTSFDRNVQLY